jgi:hypothetical protein
VPAKSAIVRFPRSLSNAIPLDPPRSLHRLGVQQRAASVCGRTRNVSRSFRTRAPQFGSFGPRSCRRVVRDAVRGRGLLRGCCTGAVRRLRRDSAARRFRSTEPRLGSRSLGASEPQGLRGRRAPLRPSSP